MVGRLDSQLLNDYIHGDGQAFEELVERHKGMVLGVCRRITKNSEDAEDAAQATFLLLASRAKKLHSHPSIAGWLHLTATNVARTTLRSADRRKHWESKAMSEIEVGQQAAPEHQEYFFSILDQALLMVPKRDRDCLVLHYVEGLSPAELASQLEIKGSTLSMRMARARERLRKQLRKLGLPLTGSAVAVLLATPLSASASTEFAGAVSVAASQLQASGVGSITGVSPSVVSLTQGVLKTMFVKKLVIASTLMLMVGTAGYALTALPVETTGSGDQAEPAVTRAQERVGEPATTVTAKKLIEVGDWGFLELTHDKSTGKVTLKTLNAQKKPVAVNEAPVLVLVSTNGKKTSLKMTAVSDITYELTDNALKAQLTGYVMLNIGSKTINVAL